MSDDINLVVTPGRTVYRVDRPKKRALLRHLVNENSWSRIMVYVRTKYAVARLGKQLEQDGFTVALVHNSMGKVRRIDAVQAFTDGAARILVSSDMATRGMQLPESIDCVISLDLPTEPCLEQREAALARAGQKLFLLSNDEEADLNESPLFAITDYQFEVVEGFTPDPEAAQKKPQKTESGPEKSEQATPGRRVRRGHGSRKQVNNRQKANHAERNNTKPQAKRRPSNGRTQLDENGDINGNTLVSDNSNRSAIELACDGTQMAKKRGSTRFKNRQGNGGQKRQRRQVPSIMGG